MWSVSTVGTRYVGLWGRPGASACWFLIRRLGLETVVKSMNAVEIEEAVSALAAAPFDSQEFPYSFLAAFGNKETTIQRLRSGSSNTSDIPGGVLQRTNIHIATCDVGKVGENLTALKASPKSAKGKVKFVLATDGIDFEAEELATGETMACAYRDFANHFGFFLPLAGISTVAQIKDNPIDIRATSRLNKLYVELLKENEDWSSDARRQDLIQFMARLIFCFFAEDTGIFNSEGLFTACIKKMTANDSSNTHEVIKELFRAMDTKPDDRKSKDIKSWAQAFPYVNGGLFTKQIECPRFSKIARSYLIRAGELNWKEINPDIFGSMIQAVADDDERGELGMHYTSVPNILKVLEPLILDDLWQQLEEAEDNPRKLLNLRKRMAAIRVFDPACGSGNFLVIAYIKMREIEAEIVKRRKEQHSKEAQKSWIKLTNFYGIEIKCFAAEIARLALLIAEFQCNVRLIGQREACLDVLPLHDTGQIHIGNALRQNWLRVCPAPSNRIAVEGDSVGQAEQDTLNDVGSDAEVATFICGNPPYLGAKKKSPQQIEDMELAGLEKAKLLDYVAAFLVKAHSFAIAQRSAIALVATSSICQGEQVSLLWPNLLRDLQIRFAYTPFKWANSAANNAGVYCTIVGLVMQNPSSKILFDGTSSKLCRNISPYLIEGDPIICSPSRVQLSGLPKMEMGSNPVD